jgi:hypothetical protein
LHVGFDPQLQLPFAATHYDDSDQYIAVTPHVCTADRSSSATMEGIKNIAHPPIVVMRGPSGQPMGACMDMASVFGDGQSAEDGKDQTPSKHEHIPSGTLQVSA